MNCKQHRNTFAHPSQGIGVGFLNPEIWRWKVERPGWCLVARIFVKTLDDFKKVVKANAKTQTHMAIDEPQGYLILVPVVTSSHRHYIILDSDEETKEQAKKWLEQEGFEIVSGNIDWSGNC